MGTNNSFLWLSIIAKTIVRSEFQAEIVVTMEKLVTNLGKYLMKQKQPFAKVSLAEWDQTVTASKARQCQNTTICFLLPWCSSQFPNLVSYYMKLRQWVVYAKKNGLFYLQKVNKNSKIITDRFVGWTCVFIYSNSKIFHQSNCEFHMISCRLFLSWFSIH